MYTQAWVHIEQIAFHLLNLSYFIVHIHYGLFQRKADEIQ